MSTSYASLSPLQRHKLDSLLPYEVKPYESKPTLKTREFYKPQQFIWNNPHRTSDNIYKFYHKYNDQYERTKAPMIQKLEQEERKERDLNRIKNLTQMRHQTRKRFFTRQKDRQTLQCLSGTRQQTQNDQNLTLTAAKKFSTVSHYHSKPSKFQPMIPSYLPSKIPARKSNTLLHNIEQTYLTGVQKSDMKRKLIEGLIVSQTHRHQDGLRDDFERQKEMNSRRMSQITRFETSKFDVRSVYKEA